MRGNELRMEAMNRRMFGKRGPGNSHIGMLDKPIEMTCIGTMKQRAEHRSG